MSASVRPSAIFGKSSRAYSVRNTICGFIYLGKISRSEKSKIQNVIWYRVIVTTSSFSEEKIKNVLRSIYDPKIWIFHKWVHMHSVKSKNVQLFAEWKSWSTSDWRQTSSTQESLKGPPLPCGCNLVNMPNQNLFCSICIECNCPSGAFVWQTLKNRCPYASGFFGKPCGRTASVTRFLGSYT